MKRSAALALAITLAVLALTGCGDASGQAKVYMKSGDAALTSVEPVYKDMVQATMTLALDYATGVNTEPASVKTKVDGIEAQLSKANEGTAKAKREYEKTYKLEGVHDYKEYVLVQQELIDLLDATRTTVSEILDMVKASSESGQAPDSERLNRLAEYLGLLSLRAGEVKVKAAEVENQREL